MSKYVQAPLYLVKLENGRLMLADDQGRVISKVLSLDITQPPDDHGAILHLQLHSQGFDVGLPSGVSLAIKHEEGSQVVKLGDVPLPPEHRYKFGGNDDA